MNDSKDLEEAIAPKFLTNCFSHVVSLTQSSNSVLSFLTLSKLKSSFLKKMNLDFSKESLLVIKISSSL